MTLVELVHVVRAAVLGAVAAVAAAWRIRAQMSADERLATLRRAMQSATACQQRAEKEAIAALLLKDAAPSVVVTMLPTSDDHGPTLVVSRSGSVKVQ